MKCFDDIKNRDECLLKISVHQIIPYATQITTVSLPDVTVWIYNDITWYKVSYQMKHLSGLLRVSLHPFSRLRLVLDGARSLNNIFQNDLHRCVFCLYISGSFTEV